MIATESSEKIFAKLTSDSAMEVPDPKVAHLHKWLQNCAKRLLWRDPAHAANSHWAWVKDAGVLIKLFLKLLLCLSLPKQNVKTRNKYNPDNKQ